ncbi:MAG: hypothetical protein GQ545_09455 [Candidatus Aminicenantes bacterium]|nr:hypothetical protein [Candidatus Aminicenantes bacterium]
MRKLPAIIAVFLLCLPLFVYPDNGAEYYDYSFARMSYVTGDVFIERASDMGYEQGTVNLPVVENDKLGTRDGRAEIHFGKKNYLRIDRYTHVDFASLPRKGYDQVKLNLLSGNIYLRVNFLGREKDFEVHTPDASFYILEEGLYGIKVVENSETEIHVVEGAVEAAGGEGSVLVESEERLVVSNGAFRSGPEYLYASYSDSFAEWNNSRDALHNRSVQKTYLPSELYEYESELATNGDWAYEASYGYVWVPHVYHHTWRPYHDGRWLWYPVCGWTWIPYASWGWCVSHYGRWHWRFGLGWHWIPTSSWGPAWVHWYSGYNYIGWCPVSYWGYPVVIQNNYFYGRWNDRYYPVNSRALTVIRKNQLQAPRISKVALSQSHANRLGKISLAANQPKVKATIQRNSLTHQKASKVLARSNIRKVGKNYSSTSALRSTSRSHSAKVTSKVSSKRTMFSSKSVKTRSSRSMSSESSQRTRARTAIKTYPSRAISSVRSRSSLAAGRTSRSSAVKIYPSRNSYSSRGSSKSNSNRYSSTPRTSTKGTSSYSNTSRYSRPSRYSSSSERLRSSSSSYRSSPSVKSSSSYRSSPRSPSRGSVSSSRPSSSSSRSSRSYTRSSRSSSSHSSAPSRVSSSRSSSPSRGRTSSGSKSVRSVSKGSAKVKRK